MICQYFDEVTRRYRSFHLGVVVSNITLVSDTFFDRYQLTITWVYTIKSSKCGISHPLTYVRSYGRAICHYPDFLDPIA